MSGEHLGRLAHDLMLALHAACSPEMRERLRGIDVVLLVGRDAEAPGGKCNRAALIARHRQPGLECLNAVAELLLQQLADIIDGDVVMLNNTVTTLTEQVVAEVAAAAERQELDG